MRIISGFKHPCRMEWGKALDNLAASAHRFGYCITIADLPTVDAWITKYEEIFLSLCWKYKILFMIECLENYKDDLLWIDGDCLINREINFNDVMSGCDVAFTLRDIENRHQTSEPQRDGLLNSGVIFIKNNDASRDFFESCRKHLLLSLYDQEAFNVFLLKSSQMKLHGEIITAGGAKIKMLNCREYNNFYDDDSFVSARIQHFKGSIGRAKYRALQKVVI